MSLAGRSKQCVFAVLRGGKVIESPKFFRQLERKLKRACRALSRKEKGSKNQQKARLKLARVHERIADQRSDFIEQVSTSIVRKNHAVYVEALDVAGLAKGRSAKSVRDASFGKFLSALEAKCARYGRTFVKIDRWFPSTQLCSTCGALTGPKGTKGLSVRAWKCTCGAFHDRDRNAEINIRREGRRILAQGRSTHEVCGEKGAAKRLRSTYQPGESPQRAQDPDENRGRNQEPARTAAATAAA